MKGFKEAYKSIFHDYNQHESHENPFYISNIHWIYFIPKQSFVNILHGYKLVRLPYHGLFYCITTTPSWAVWNWCQQRPIISFTAFSLWTTAFEFSSVCWVYASIGCLRVRGVWEYIYGDIREFMALYCDVYGHYIGNVYETAEIRRAGTYVSRHVSSVWGFSIEMRGPLHPYSVAIASPHI